MALDAAEKAVSKAGPLVDKTAGVGLLSAYFYWDLLTHFGQLIVMGLGAALLVYRIIGQRLLNKRLIEMNRRRGIE